MAYTTPRTLLQNLKDGIDAAWSNFYLVYTPLIKFCGRKCGLEEDSLDDLVQTIMMRIFTMQNTFKYDPKKGKFRTYLGTMVSNAVWDFRKKNKTIPEDYGYQEQETELQKIIDQEWEEYATREAMLVLRQRVSEDTFQAFEMLTQNNMSPQDIAEFLDISIRNVYDAKARCIRMLKEIIGSLNE